jgi:hypothetical protein
MCTFALLGTVLSVGGALLEGQQANQMAEYQAKAYEQQAQADAQSAAFEQARERHKQDLLQSQARAQVGASGVAVAGSPTEVMAANAREGQLDLDTLQYNSRLRQNSLGTQAAISRFSGKQAQTASYFKAGSALVSGVSGLGGPGGQLKTAAKVPSRAVTFGNSALRSPMAGL